MENKKENIEPDPHDMLPKVKQNHNIYNLFIASYYGQLFAVINVKNYKIKTSLLALMGRRLEL